MPNPTLFLDFDGVLNHTGTASTFTFPDGGRFTGLDVENVARLNHVMQEVPEARIIVSSTWRTALDLSGLRDALTQFGFKYPDRVIGVTPVLAMARGEEIQSWLDAQLDGRPEPIAILDDCEDMLHLEPRLIRTDIWDGGLSDANASAVIALLRETT